MSWMPMVVSSRKDMMAIRWLSKRGVADAGAHPCDCAAGVDAGEVYGRVGGTEGEEVADLLAVDIGHLYFLASAHYDGAPVSRLG